MEEKQVYKFYVTTCLTAPLIGVAMGGFTFSQIGGYKSKQSFGLTAIMICVGALIAMPIPFLKTVNATFICVWLVFFCGSFVTPTLTGILLQMVKPEMRITAQAVATLSFNMIGYLPAPFIYGFVSDLPLGSPQMQQRFAIASILYALIPASILLASAFAIKYEFCCSGNKTDKRKTLTEWN